MSEIPTKLEKHGQHLLSNCLGEEVARARSNGWLGLREEEDELIYSKRISTGWWLQPVLEVAI